MSLRKVAFLGPATVVTPLAFREALSFEGHIPDLLILLSVGAAFAFGFPLSSFTFISLIFPTPIAFLGFSGLSFKLSYFLAAGLCLSSIIKMLRRRSSLWPLLAGGLWVLGFIASGMVPFWKQQNLADGSGAQNFYLTISLVFFAGFIFASVCDNRDIRSMVTKIAEAMVAIFIFWLFMVFAVLRFRSGALFDVRTSHFLFPVDETYLATGAFLIATVLFIVLHGNQFRHSGTVRLVTITLLATALGMSSSRATAIAAAVIVLGLLGQAIHEKKLKYFWVAVCMTAGFALAILVSRVSPVRSFYEDFSENPIASGVRLRLLRAGISNLRALAESKDPERLFFGVGYGQTTKEFGGVFDAHNDIITTLVERGLIGTVIIFFPLYFLLRQARALLPREKVLATAGGFSFFVMLFFALTGMAHPIMFLTGISFGSGIKRGIASLPFRRPAI